MQSRTERYMAWFPVNQWVVLFEPIVSKNYRAGRVEQGCIECQSEHFTSRKSYREFRSLGNERVASSIKEVESNGWNCKGRNAMGFGECRIQKKMWGTRVLEPKVLTRASKRNRQMCIGFVWLGRLSQCPVHWSRGLLFDRHSYNTLGGFPKCWAQ